MQTLVIGGVEAAIDDPTVQWRGGLQVDADGAPNAYCPLGATDTNGRLLRPLDRLGNAGRPGHWAGIVTDTGLPSGKPIIQGPGDPFPGFYVSQTAFGDRSRPERDPLRYVNADKVPYLSIPPELERLDGMRLLRMGDVGIACYRDRIVDIVLAEVGPHGKLGEGSMALARRLGIDPSPRDGGIGGGVSVVIYRGSSRPWPRTLDSISEQVAALRAPQIVSG